VFPLVSVYGSDFLKEMNFRNTPNSWFSSSDPLLERYLNEGPEMFYDDDDDDDDTLLMYQMGI